MKKVAYYISDYGFGHATRSAAVIQELLRQTEDIEVTVCHSYAAGFLTSALPDPRVEIRSVQTDIGYFLMETSIEPDVTRLNDEYDQYMECWPDLIKEEAAFLQGEDIDLVLADISPIAFEAAHKAGIPSIGISNFTWHTAYQGLINNQKLETFKTAYEKMTYFFSLAGSREPERTETIEKKFGFFSRELDDSEIQRIRQSLNPNGDKCIIYFGLGMKIDVKELEQLPLWDSDHCVFVVSSNTHVEKANVFRIPSDYIDSQNYIAASDLAITKAGWGTVSEAIAGGTPLLIIDRQTMREDQNTIAYLKQHELCQTITWEELQQLVITDGFMDEVNRTCKVDNFSHTNEVGNIAKEILTIVERV